MTQIVKLGAWQDPYFTYDPNFKTCATKQWSTQILGFQANFPVTETTSSSESDINMNLLKYRKQNII